MYQQSSMFGYQAAPPRPVPYEPNFPSPQQNGFPRNSNKLTMDESVITELLKNLEKRDLQGLLDDESKLNDLVNDFQQVTSIQVDRETLLASNKSIAEYNLSMMPKLENLKSQLATGHEEIRRLQGKTEEDRARLLLSCDGQSPEMLLALLQTKFAETEEESEALADSFCDKEIPVDAFIEKFLSLRTSAHLLRVKSEKMVELVENQSRRPPVPPPRPSSKTWYNNNTPATGLSAPYGAPSTQAFAAPYPATNSYMMMPEPFLPR